MSVIYDVYVDRRSFLHGLDPRVKLSGVIVGMVITFIFSSLPLVLVYYILLVAVLLSAKVGMRNYLYIVKLMLPITVLIIVFWPIFYHEGGAVLFQLGPLRVSLPSLIRGVTLAVRLNCLAILAYIFLYTTTQRQMIKGSVKLGLPYKYGTMLSISVRYLPTFGGIISMIMEAQKARGLELERGSFFQRIKKYVTLMVPTIIAALKMSDNLAIAMESRAFGAPMKKTYLVDLKVKRRDLITLFFVLSAFVLVLLTKFWLQIDI